MQVVLMFDAMADGLALLRRTQARLRSCLALPLLAVTLSFMATLPAVAQNVPPMDKPFAEHKLALQLSDNDPKKEGLVISVAYNLLKFYGPDKVAIEVVTFGPGIDLLKADNPNRTLVDSLVAQGVRFDVCGNTLDTLECLRYAPYEKVNAFFNSTGGSGWNPIVDGDFIQRWGSLQLEDGDFVRVPIISGANTDEGTAFGPRGINSEADFATTLTGPSRNVYLPERYVPEILEAYPNTPDYYIPPVDEIGNLKH